ncbi:MAG: glycine cleavage system aminomethyltransferase GcvT [Fimbriimonadaceae bacterium]
MADSLLRTALYDEHVALGAKIVPFAGYDMPVQYAGVIAESQSVRQDSGMFDVSHMARLRIRGPRALEFLEWVTTNDVAKLTDGVGQYSLLPNERGGVVDDVIVYRVGPETFRMVVNAANHDKDVAWLNRQNETGGFGVRIEDETADTAMIAVQGPRAAEIVATLSDAPAALRDAPVFGAVDAKVADVPCFAARSGYTGEDGFELVCLADRAVELWQALLRAGVAPCGLGARDVLRVEAGLPLYGHELTEDLSPLCAGLGWVIGKEKSFVGSDKIAEVRATGAPWKLVGIRLTSKRLLQPGMKVFVDGREIGTISSGVYSPVLETSIAFAFVHPDTGLRTPCEVDVRGRMEPGTVVGKRFLKKPTP